jgi:purine catabolism regulator
MEPILPTLHELLRLSLNEPAQWLSQKPATDLAISWVTSSLEDTQPGDLLLLAAEQFSASTLKKARGKGVVVVLGLGEVSVSSDDIPDRLYAGVLPAFTGDVRKAEKLLLGMLVNQRAALMDRGASIHAQLSQMEAEGKGLEGLVKAISEISDRGVLVQDKRGQILAHQPSSALTTSWVNVLEHLKGLSTLPADLIDRKRAASQPACCVQDVPGNLERLVAPIIVGEMARGYLSLVAGKGDLDTLDHLAAEQGGLVCGIEMARNKAIRETEKRLKGDLLTAILQARLAARDAALWLQTMGLDLDQSHVALRFSWDGVEAPSRRRLETIVNGEIARLAVKAIVHPMGSEVTSFCQVSSGEARPEVALALGAAVLKEAAYEYANTPCRCGVGPPALELEDWRASFSHAGQALELARRLNSAQPLYYADLSVYRLLFQIEHSPELMAFQEEILGPLLSAETDGELIHTLEAFFANNGNLTQTAETLYIHRNTLIYRLERINAITGLDLDKPENRLAIQLALHIHRMTGPIRQVT